MAGEKFGIDAIFSEKLKQQAMMMSV